MLKKLRHLSFPQIQVRNLNVLWLKTEIFLSAPCRTEFSSMFKAVAILILAHVESPIYTSLLTHFHFAINADKVFRAFTFEAQ